MASRRVLMVSKQMRDEISMMLIREIKDPRIGFVTITQVEVSPDLGRAKVLYSVVGTEEEIRMTQDGLESAIPFIRGRLGRRLSNLKHIPHLTFKFDSSLAKGIRVLSLINRLNG